VSVQECRSGQGGKLNPFGCAAARISKASTHRYNNTPPTTNEEGSVSGRAMRPDTDQADLQLVQALSHVPPQPSLVLSTGSDTTGAASTMVTSRSKSASSTAFGMVASILDLLWST
jgi:hypothetical protein